MRDEVQQPREPSMRDAAIHRIGHDIRSPLTVILGFCELLQEEGITEADLVEFTSRISANAMLLQAAVERLFQELDVEEYAEPPGDQMQQSVRSPHPNRADSWPYTEFGR